MSRALSLFLALLGLGAVAVVASRPTPCTIAPQGHVAQAGPVSLMTRVVIEPGLAGRSAVLALSGAVGVERSSLLHADVRTQWVSWPSLALDPGTYTLALRVSDGCKASTRFIVGGN